MRIKQTPPLPDEAISCEALRLLKERDQVQALHRDEIRKRIAEGMASLRAGKGTDGDVFFDKLDAELNEPKTSRPV